MASQSLPALWNSMASCCWWTLPLAFQDGGSKVQGCCTCSGLLVPADTRNEPLQHQQDYAMRFICMFWPKRHYPMHSLYVLLAQIIYLTPECAAACSFDILKQILSGNLKFCAWSELKLYAESVFVCHKYILPSPRCLKCLILLRASVLASKY
jgi:hypothetical protein